MRVMDSYGVPRVNNFRLCTNLEHNINAERTGNGSDRTFVDPTTDHVVIADNK